MATSDDQAYDDAIAYEEAIAREQAKSSSRHEPLGPITQDASEPEAAWQPPTVESLVEEAKNTPREAKVSLGESLSRGAQAGAGLGFTPQLSGVGGAILKGVERSPLGNLEASEYAGVIPTGKEPDEAPGTTLEDLLQEYRNTRDFQAKRQSDAYRSHPGAYTVGAIAGGGPSAAAIPAGRLVQGGIGAVTGLAEGGPKQAAINAATGLLLGGAGKPAANIVGKVAQRATLPAAAGLIAAAANPDNALESGLLAAGATAVGREAGGRVAKYVAGKAAAPLRQIKNRATLAELGTSTANKKAIQGLGGTTPEALARLAENARDEGLVPLLGTKTGQAEKAAALAEKSGAKIGEIDAKIAQVEDATGSEGFYYIGDVMRDMYRRSRAALRRGSEVDKEISASILERAKLLEETIRRRLHLNPETPVPDHIPAQLGHELMQDNIAPDLYRKYAKNKPAGTVGSDVERETLQRFYARMAKEREAAANRTGIKGLAQEMLDANEQNMTAHKVRTLAEADMLRWSGNNLGGLRSGIGLATGHFDTALMMELGKRYGGKIIADIAEGGQKAAQAIAGIPDPKFRRIAEALQADTKPKTGSTLTVKRQPRPPAPAEGVKEGWMQGNETPESPQWTMPESESLPKDLAAAGLDLDLSAPTGKPSRKFGGLTEEDLFRKVQKLMPTWGGVSIVKIQRELGLGYDQAKRIFDRIKKP